MESAVRIENGSRTEIKKSACRRNNAVCNVLGRTPTLDGSDTLRDQLVVFLRYDLCHRRLYNTGSHLENRDPVLRKLDGKKESRHRNARLGNTVLTAAR